MRQAVRQASSSSSEPSANTGWSGAEVISEPNPGCRGTIDAKLQVVEKACLALLIGTALELSTLTSMASQMDLNNNAVARGIGGNARTKLDVWFGVWNAVNNGEFLIKDEKLVSCVRRTVTTWAPAIGAASTINMGLTGELLGKVRMAKRSLLERRLGESSLDPHIGSARSPYFPACLTRPQGWGFGDSTDPRQHPKGSSIG